MDNKNSNNKNSVINDGDNNKISNITNIHAFLYCPIKIEINPYIKRKSAKISDTPKYTSRKNNIDLCSEIIKCFLNKNVQIYFAYMIVSVFLFCLSVIGLKMRPVLSFLVSPLFLFIIGYKYFIATNDKIKKIIHTSLIGINVFTWIVILISTFMSSQGVISPNSLPDLCMVMLVINIFSTLFMYLNNATAKIINSSV